MPANHSSTTLDALWKETYGDSLVNLVPSSAKALKKYPFKSGMKVGDYYVQPVIVSRSQGHTRGRGVQTMNDAIVSETAQAQVNPMPDYLRESVAYDAAARMVENKQSFEQWSKYLVRSMVESMSYRAELELFYGQSGIGVADSSANASGTSTVITLTAASYAPGIWAGAENAKLKFYKQSDSTLVSSGADAVFQVTAVDVDAKTITVTGTTTGITALDTAAGAGDLDIFFSDGCNAAKGDLENAGFNKIITNTGTLFNINAATYSLWKGNTYSAGSADLTIAKILKANAKGVGRGLADDVTCWVSSTTFEKLNSDQTSLRTYDSSYRPSKAESGSESLCFIGQNGRLQVEPSTMVKEGEAFLVPDKRVKRFGSTDVTFKLPGDHQDKIFLNVPDKTAYELRCMSEQAYLIEAPAQATKITGIVNS